MNKSALAISIMIIGLILLFLLFSIFGILYFYWGSVQAVQDSLSTAGSIFSAIATLGAASVAAYLFNDWKEQHNRTIIASEAKIAFKCIHAELQILRKIKRKVKVFNYSLFNPTQILENDELDKAHVTLTNEVNKNQNNLSEFVVLIDGRELFETIKLYYKSINDLNENRVEWTDNKKTYEEIFESYDLKLDKLLTDNLNILDNLKSYILYDEISNTKI
ncbi:hypothetical protein ACNQO9_00505 [Acinetobacter calcoaceticus]